MSSDLTLRPLGRIVRLQIQRSPLKLGEKPNRVYDPAAILSVDQLTLTPQGALARLPDGGTLIDIHNADHPETRNNDGINSLSVGFTTHYAAMRARYGDHVVDGCAGENILVETEGMVEMAALAGGLAIQPTGAAAPVWLRISQVAAPCRPFSGYVMRTTEAAVVKETLQFLDNGMRGYYCALAQAGAVTVAVGDRVMLPPP